MSKAVKCQFYTYIYISYISLFSLESCSTLSSQSSQILGPCNDLKLRIWIEPCRKFIGFAKQFDLDGQGEGKKKLKAQPMLKPNIWIPTPGGKFFMAFGMFSNLPVWAIELLPLKDMARQGRSSNAWEQR